MEARQELSRSSWDSGNSRVAASYSSPTPVSPSVTVRSTWAWEDGETLAYAFIMEWRASQTGQKQASYFPDSALSPFHSQNQPSHQAPTSDPTHAHFLPQIKRA